MSSNLYLIINFFETTLFFSIFTALNLQTVDIWHSRLGNLEKQNIVKLVKMYEEISLFQPPSSDTCASCTCHILPVKTHIDSLFSGQKDWIWYIAML